MAEISSLDLHYLIKEMNLLEGARVDKIVQPSQNEVVFQFYASGKGKKMLRIALPSLFYMASIKPSTPEKIFGFCSALRKYLSNARLEKIEQVGSERIAKLLFKAKESEYLLFAELFSKGNMILCRKDMAIIVPVVSYKTKEREIKAGAKYNYPRKDVDFFKLTLNDMKKMFGNKEMISKTLAVQFGFGGVYAKELCLIAGIEPNSKEIDENEIKALLKSIKSITSKKISPVVYYSNSKIKDIKPFELEIYKGLRKEGKATFSSAVEFAAGIEAPKKITKSQKELARLQKIISMQESKINELGKSAEENTRKGELIYEKYQLLGKVLEEIKKARKTHSWKEIKEKLKSHKLIKDVNVKTGEIVVEV